MLKKRGFTLAEVMIANMMLIIFVAGFGIITEQIFEQIKFRKQKAEMASPLDLGDCLKAGKNPERRGFIGETFRGL